MSKILLHARVDTSLHKWIKEQFPHGFIQVFVEECFTHLRTMIDEGRMPAPSEYSRRAAILAVANLVQNKSEMEENDEESNYHS